MFICKRCTWQGKNLLIWKHHKKPVCPCCGTPKPRKKKAKAKAKPSVKNFGIIL